MAFDSGGDVYTTGLLEGSVQFGNTLLTSHTDNSGNSTVDAFVAKIDPNGNFLWAIDLGGAGDDRGESIAVDGSGNPYVTGYFTGPATFAGTNGATTTLSGLGGTDVFVAKISADGSSLTAWQMGGAGNDQGTGIAVGTSGNVYLTGYFQGAASFGTDSSGNAVNLTTTGAQAAFVIAFDPLAGQTLWADQISGATTARQSIAVGQDSSGADVIYAGGQFSGTAQFNPSIPTILLSGSANGSPYVAKLDSSGNFLWAQNVLASSIGSVSGLALDSSGNLYVAANDGSTSPGTVNTPQSSTGFDVVRLDPSSGSLAWTRSIRPAPVTDQALGSSTSVNAIAVDGSGDVYTTGYFDGLVDFDPGPGIAYMSSSSTGYPYHSIFVSKLDSSGNFVSARRMGGADSQPSSDAIAVDGAGNIITAGALNLNGATVTDQLDIGDQYVTVTSSTTNSFVVKTPQDHGAVLGFLYNDLNGNGQQDATPIQDPNLIQDPGSTSATPDVVQATERGMANQTVFIDTNNNGVLDPGEPTATTDALGAFEFNFLPSGTYTVRQVVPSGAWQQTQPGPSTPGSQLSYGQYVYSDSLAPGQFVANVFGDNIPSQWLTYASTNVPVSLPNRGWNSASSTLSINDSFPIFDANFTADITDNSDGAFSSSLKSPDGTSSGLITYAGYNAYALGITNSNTNFVNTTLDQDSTTSIENAAAPFNGSYLPFGDLSVLNGHPVQGTWTLTMSNGNLNKGKLTRWWLTFLGPQYATIGTLSSTVSGSAVTLSVVGFSDLLGNAESSVSFYQDTNKDGMLEVGADKLLGTVAPGSGGTASLAISKLSAGSYTFFAQAQDGQQHPSNILSTTSQVATAQTAVPQVSTMTNVVGTQAAFSLGALPSLPPALASPVSSPSSVALAPLVLDTPDFWGALHPLAKRRWTR